ncbi:MAG: helix-turn-helix domain-containing protein [Proteobacteria bacterium]|nr:helix-turn-helix domain-containing protein [Pseudomonadota bacterium]MCH8347518.1 helix-turn-helix domain-containing protein [Pseudomonadota bacterium]
MTDQTTFKDFKKKALKKTDVKAAYDELAPAYAMKRKMIAMRKAKGLTQTDMAILLGTKKSNISRLESVISGASPRLATVESYAQALGFRMKIEFEAERPKDK